IEAWEKAKTIWTRLRPKIIEREAAALETIHNTAEFSMSDDSLALFRQRLEGVLASDPALTAELLSIIPKTTGVANDGTIVLTGHLDFHGDGVVIGNSNSVIIKK